MRKTLIFSFIFGFVLSAYAQTPGAPAYLTLSPPSSSASCTGPIERFVTDYVTPSLPNQTNTTGRLEIGTWFTPAVDGWIDAIKFYKATSSVGTHYGDIFDNGGNLIAETTFINETASGWQTQYLSMPVRLHAGQMYFVAYSTPDYYVATPSYLASGLTSGDLSISSTQNTQFSYAAQGTFPTSTDTGTYYFVDLVFDKSTCISDSYPNATNTGYTGTLTPSGDITASTVGQVVQNVDVTGTIYVTANNVTIQNCRVTSSVQSGQIAAAAGVTGLTVTHCEVNGLGATAYNITGSGTFTYNNLYGAEKNIELTGNAVIENNYMHEMSNTANPTPHFENVDAEGGQTSLLIQHNTMINVQQNTAAVMLANYYGGLTGITVTDNIMVGGNYPVYCDGHFAGGSVGTVAYTNNHIGSGFYGATDFNTCTPTFTGNTYDGWTWATLIGN